VADAFDFAAELLYERWRRAVDLLWRETVRRREARLDERERRRSARRMKNLQKIVRRALADYHRIELERQKSRP
jgi:DNA-binding transcriptional regulator GbsR (MarR family)